MHLRHRDRLGHPRAQTLPLVGHHAGQESLAFADPLHLDGDRLHGLPHRVEAIGEVRGNGSDRRGTTPPDATRIRDGDRRQHEDREDDGHCENLARRSIPFFTGLLGGAGQRGRLCHGGVSFRDLLIHGTDATVDLFDARFDAGPIGRIADVAVPVPVQLFAKVLPLLLEALELIAQLTSLRERPLIHLGRRARDLAGRRLHHKRHRRGSGGDGNFLHGDEGNFLHEVGDWGACGTFHRGSDSPAVVRCVRVPVSATTNLASRRAARKVRR